MAPFRRAALYVVHLRLLFQPTLAPIFLWGALLSGGRWDDGTTAAFIALHLFLYPAATAFNSAFDKDEGPEAPPGLAGFAIAFAAAGAVSALFAGAGFLFTYALIVVWAAAYSHPATRRPGDPATRRPPSPRETGFTARRFGSPAGRQPASCSSSRSRRSGGAGPSRSLPGAPRTAAVRRFGRGPAPAPVPDEASSRARCPPR